MLLAVIAAVAALVAVLADLIAPRVVRRWRNWRSRPRLATGPILVDPGRDLRAEQRARDLLRSCVNAEDWDMYRDLGFLRVSSRSADPAGDEPCAYLLYPHRPIVAYLPSTRRLIGEYCVSFEDPDRTYASGRLPDSDDVLAKWMALTGDEPGLIAKANMHLPGRQIDTRQVGRDLVRLAQWDQDRARRQESSAPAIRADLVTPTAS